MIEGANFTNLTGVSFNGRAATVYSAPAYTQIRVTVLSGLSTDLVTGQTRRWIGPELGAPRLFSDRVGVSAGYVQEGGWAPGRSAWLQVLTRPAMLVQILTRLSWSRTRSTSAAGRSILLITGMMVRSCSMAR